MTYGMKKKKKPERKNLTFGMAKNRWLDYMHGRKQYSNAVALIDEIRNDYLLGDEEKWSEWKATPIVEFDEKLIGFIEWKASNIEINISNPFEFHNKLGIVEIFMEYVNGKLIKTDFWDASLKKSEFALSRLKQEGFDKTIEQREKYWGF